MRESPGPAATERPDVPRAVRAAFVEGDPTAPATSPDVASVPPAEGEAAPAAPGGFTGAIDPNWSCPPRLTARIHWVGAYAGYRHPADLWAEILSNLEGLVVIDARFPEAYAREHLPGAVSMPVKTINSTSTAGLPRDAKIVVYCWNESCHASSRAAGRLRQLGFTVEELHGGLETWKRLGYPTERG